MHRETASSFSVTWEQNSKQGGIQNYVSGYTGTQKGISGYTGTPKSYFWLHWHTKSHFWLHWHTKKSFLVTLTQKKSHFWLHSHKKKVGFGYTGTPKSHFWLHSPKKTINCSCSKLKFYCSSFDDKNKSVSILSLLHGSVNCHEAQIVALILLFHVNDPSPSYVPSFGEKD